MSSRQKLIFVALLSLGSLSTPAYADDRTAQHVRSLLSNSCFACHGPDQEKREGGFRLDQIQSMRGEADSGETPVVVGEPGKSELLRRITTSDEDERMPPRSFGKRLEPQDVEAIRQWILDGAEFPQHWSFVPPNRSLPPQFRDVANAAQGAGVVIPADWQLNPIDRYVLQRQLELGLSPSQPATKSELLRRLSLDLIGLPPTPEQVAAFERDTAFDSYERQVDRLLASPAFGENWARKWLDLARYADSAGYADDPARTIWGYRDWTINALNANMPIDQFTIEQLAGDLLPHPTPEQIVATAFHRNTTTNNEGGTNDEEFRSAAIVDRVNTTLAVWMGVTMACAQCHTHKYDPFTQEEYFKLYAIFNQTQDADRRDESPVLELYSEAQLRQKQQWEQRTNELIDYLKNPSPQILSGVAEWESSLCEPRWSTLIPSQGSSSSKSDFVFDENQIKVKPTGNNIVSDTYSLKMQTGSSASQSIHAIGLRTLPDKELPQAGAGLSSSGNFVITEVAATVFSTSKPNQQLARFIRVELPGKDKFLSLAEVQVFVDGKNVALAGQATQSSTAYAAGASRAIDGDTDGDFDRWSTTHSEKEKNPWWEVDLGTAQVVERVVVWNRTGDSLYQRLDGVTLQLLDADRKPLLERVIKKAPKVSEEISTNVGRSLKFTAAYADYSQQDFTAANVIDQNAATGWAIGGSVAESHLLTLIPSEPLELEPSDVLELEIDHKSAHRHHLLGSFRIEISEQAGVGQWSSLSPELVAVHRKPLAERSSTEQQALASFYSQTIAAENSEQRTELAELTIRLAELKPETSVPVLRQLEPQSQRETFVQIRGNYKSLGDKVTPGTPAVFHPLEGTSEPDRLALAKWLVDRRNPLTARVWVNRLWESLFGIGIVRTSEEFGAQGDKPSHPELLDWLACELMDSQWDAKRLLKLMVTSQTYRQTSRVSPAALEEDQENVWLARGPRVRLSAEMVRDQALSVAGLLTNTMYGPPVRPPQPNMGLKAAFGSDTDWKTSEGEDRYRRGIYTTWRRSNPYPSMATFDAPSREVCTLRRDSTNTPLQALVTLNDPGFVEAAQGLARLVVLYEGQSCSEAARLQIGFRRCTSRDANERELAALANLLDTAREHFKSNQADAVKLATDPLGPLDSTIQADETQIIELAAWTSVCNVLLNVDELLMKR